MADSSAPAAVQQPAQYPNAVIVPDVSFPDLLIDRSNKKIGEPSRRRGARLPHGHVSIRLLPFPSVNFLGLRPYTKENRDKASSTQSLSSSVLNYQ